MRISLKDAVHLFKEWKDSASLINVTLALEDKLDRFDAVICAVSPFGRLMFLPTKGSRRVVNLRKADFRRVDVGKLLGTFLLWRFSSEGLLREDLSHSQSVDDLNFSNCTTKEGQALAMGFSARIVQECHANNRSIATISSRAGSVSTRRSARYLTEGPKTSNSRST